MAMTETIRNRGCSPRGARQGTTGLALIYNKNFAPDLITISHKIFIKYGPESFSIEFLSIRRVKNNENKIFINSHFESRAFKSGCHNHPKKSYLIKFFKVNIVHLNKNRIL